MWQVPPVEDVMLEHEEDVEQDGEQSEAELGGVAEEGAPVVVVVGDEDHLEDAEGASGEVEEDVANAPTNGTLASEVHVGLGDILDQRDPELHIGAVEEEVQPGDDTDAGEDEGDDDEDEDGSEDGETPPGDLLAAPLVHHALDDRDGAGEDGVDWEEDVIGFDWNDATRMTTEVIILD